MAIFFVIVFLYILFQSTLAANSAGYKSVNYTVNPFKDVYVERHHEGGLHIQKNDYYNNNYEDVYVPPEAINQFLYNDLLHDQKVS